MAKVGISPSNTTLLNTTLQSVMADFGQTRLWPALSPTLHLVNQFWPIHFWPILVVSDEWFGQLGPIHFGPVHFGVVGCVVGCCWFGPSGQPSAGPPFRGIAPPQDRPSAGPLLRRTAPPPDRPKNRSFFPLSRSPFRSVFLSLGVFSWNCGNGSRPRPRLFCASTEGPEAAGVHGPPTLQAHNPSPPSLPRRQIPLFAQTTLAVSFSCKSGAPPQGVGPEGGGLGTPEVWGERRGVGPRSLEGEGVGPRKVGL